MKQRTFLESFIVRPRPVFQKYLYFCSSHHQNYTKAGLEYTTNFESHQVQKCLTCNQNTLMKSKLIEIFKLEPFRSGFHEGSSHFGL